jgi:ABC-type branched-subunit amino acid transport system ATPase component/MFS family permease
MTETKSPMDGTPAISRRDLIPSTREETLGVKRSEFVVEDRGAQPKRTFKQWLSARLADMDPRHVEGPKRPALILGLATFVAAWDVVAFELLLPEMRADFGFSLQFLTSLASVLGIIALIFNPVMGYLADRVSRVWIIRIGSLLTEAGSIITGLAGAIPILVLGRTLNGAGTGVSEPAAFPLLTDWYPSSARGRVFGFLTFSAVCGGLVAPSVAGHLAEWFGWRAAIVAVGVLALIVTLGMFFLKEPVRGYWDRKEMGADEDVALAEQKPVGWSEAWRAARSITTLRRLWYATIPLAVGGTGLGLFVGLYYAQEFGLGPRARGYIGTGTGVVILISLLFAAPVADRLLAFKPGRVMLALGIVLLGEAASVLVLVLSHNLWISVVAGLPVAAAATILTPATDTLVSLVVPARIRGLGLQTDAPWRLAAFLILPIVGGAADHFGLRKGILVFIPIFVLGSIILASSAFGVDRDIRAARAASMADEEARRARRSGRNKMIICRDVDVTYDGVQVLFNLDFDVEEGELVALLGTNGAGKSTLLRAICGTQEASNGAIFLDGQDITHVPPHENAKNGIVMVPGGHAVFPTLTVRENLRTAAWMYADDEGYVRTKTEEVLNFFPILRERLDQTAGNLSGGEQQMIALGQAFLMKPRLLMIDELSLGLAPAIVDELLRTLRQIHEQGTTIVIVEQSLNVAVSIAHRAVFMEKGEIRFDGPTEDLMRRPELVRAVFMGGVVAGPSSSSVGPARQRHIEERDAIFGANDLHVAFGGVNALSGAHIDVAGGEIVGVIGPNGAGKTTLFDVLSGFVAPDSGTVVFDGTDVTALSPDARARLGIGRSFQNATLFPSMTVRENIAVALERHIEAKSAVLAALWSPATRNTERKVRRRVDGLVELLGLQAYADKFVNELSTGTRRAVDIACVMASEPRVLMLDEPSSGLAQAETEELGPVLTRLVRDTGCGLIVIEHDIPLISSVSDRLVAMVLGEVVSTGKPLDVITDPIVTASYLSASDEVLARSDVGSLGRILQRTTATKRKVQSDDSHTEE